MVKISDLTVPQDSEKQKVNMIIPTPNGDIVVYEPTIEQADKILDLVQNDSDEVYQGLSTFSGVQVLKVLFPMLTNIDFEDKEDEELAEIIENPSIYLLQAQDAVRQIISSINVSYALRVKAEYSEAESTIRQAELLGMVPEMIEKIAKDNPEVSKMFDKVKEASNDLVSQEEVEDAENVEKTTIQILDKVAENEEIEDSLNEKAFPTEVNK